MKRRNLVHVTIITLVMLYLFLPLLATFLYSIATDWYRSVLPEGYTLDWYSQLYSDPRLWEAVGRTMTICVVTILASVVTMIPSIFIVTVYLPKWEKLFQALVTMPYAIPPVVLAVGLIKIYSDGPIVLSGTIWIVIGGYFVTILPYMYQGIRNSLRTVDAVNLVDAAELLGASKMQAFWRVIFPNILPGIIVSTLLSFSILFGEFVLANLLIGGHFEVIQVYLVRRMEENGHMSSAIVVSYFILILILSWIILKMGRREKEGRS